MGQTSSAPKGSYASWVHPTGRLITTKVDALPITNEIGQQPRCYEVRLDGRYIGHVIRWRSAAVGDSAASGVWRLNVGPTHEYPLRSYKTRGAAVDALVGIDDADSLGRYQAEGR